MHPGLLFSLSGIDGSGKTTLAYRLLERLDARYGLSCRYIWCKFGEHPLSRYRLSRYIKIDHKIPDRPGSLESASIAQTIYGVLLLQFHLAYIILVLRNLLNMGENLICDRYIFDSVVDLQQEFKFPLRFVDKVKYIKWIPQPNYKFLLDLPESHAFYRKTDTASIEFLRERREIYLSLANEYGLKVIDATKPVEEILGTITDTIGPLNIN
jgi:thymidylate kinase